jgi:hypothetical protein
MEHYDYPEVYVAYADILGFKDLVYTNAQDIVNIYKVFLQDPRVADQGALSCPLLRGRTKSPMSFSPQSDGIAVWSHDSTPDSFLRLVETIGLLFIIACDQGLPLRATITAGPLSVIARKTNEGIIHHPIGSSLLDAIAVERLQVWSGCVILGNCLEVFERQWRTHPYSRLVPSGEEWLKTCSRLFWYDVPFKKQALRCDILKQRLAWPLGQRPVVNWIEDYVSEGSIRQGFISRHAEKMNAKTRKKLRCTLAFYNKVNEQRAKKSCNQCPNNERFTFTT